MKSTPAQAGREDLVGDGEAEARFVEQVRRGSRSCPRSPACDWACSRCAARDSGRWSAPACSTFLPAQPAEQRVPGAEVLIDPDVELVRHLGRVDGVAVDRRCRRSARGCSVCSSLAATELIRVDGNAVAGNGCPVERIEDRRRQRREVPRAEGRRRHRRGRRLGARDVQPLEGAEEERAAAHQRARRGCSRSSCSRSC